MRILIYTREFAPFAGGLSTYNQELAAGLAEADQSVVVLCPRYERADEVDDGREYEVKRFRCSGHPVLKLLRATSVLLWCCCWFRPDVVLVTGRFAHVSAALSTLLVPIRCVPVVIGTEVEYHVSADTFARRLRSRSLKRFFAACERTICISEFTRALFLSVFAVAPEKVATVHIGIQEPGRVSQLRVRSLRRQLGFRSEHKVLMTLARLTPRKGQDRVIDAMPQILADCPNVRYLIVGDGEYRPQLEKRASQMGLLDSAVLLVGEVSDAEVPLYYALCDVFVMPSRKDADGVEGFGIVLVEAMLAGKPVVAGRHGGVREVVAEGETGLLVEPNSVDAIGQAVSLLVADDEWADCLGTAGRQRAQALFSRRAMARRILDVLRSAGTRGEPGSADAETMDSPP